MKREILFRGFHACEDGTEQIRLNGEVIKGKWVEGDFCHPSNICMETIEYDEVLKQDSVPIWNDYNVLPETIGQYTGLNDKNGRRIFDGDILQLCKATYPCLVYWNGTGWSIERNGKRVIYACDMDIAHDLINMEVIGNAFEVVE